MRSFFIAGTKSTASEKSFYGPWNRLLNTMFPVDSKFEVVPESPPVTLHEVVDFLILLIIYVEGTPVFVVEVKPPADFRFPSKRQEANQQLRRRLVDNSVDTEIPVLHGISAFGTKIAFYNYDLATKVTEPRKITPDPELVTDATPEEWWAFDILEEEGAKKFQDVVENVKEMCSPLLS